MQLPVIPPESLLPFIGALLVLAGILLILFGFRVLRHRKVAPGWPSVATGSILAVVGSGLLWLHLPGVPGRKATTTASPGAPVPSQVDTASPNETRASLVVYSDRLTEGWDNWSWKCKCKPDSTDYVHNGKYAIRAELEALGGLGLANRRGLNTKGYTRLEFWLNGGPVGGQQLKVFVNDSLNDGVRNPKYLPALNAGEWKRFSIPLEDLDAAGIVIFKISISETTGGGQPPFYLDDLVLVAAGDRTP